MQNGECRLRKAVRTGGVRHAGHLTLLGLAMLVSACERKVENMPTVRDAGAGAAPASQPRAIDVSKYPLQAESNDGGYFVAGLPNVNPPPLNEPFEMEIAVFRAADRIHPLRDIQLSFDADMPEHRHGMNTVATVRDNGDGTYSISGVQLHMPGFWELYADITENGVTERAQFNLTLE